MPQRGMLGAAVALALSTAAVEASSQSIQSTALPAGGRVVGGQATISQSGAAMSIQQSSARAALDWQSFNIGSQASVTFNQPSSSAIALNRVLGASGSEIFGRLSANGQVFLLNPNGVLFGRGAEVNVGGLVASTLSMSADDFMSGRYVLRGNGTAGTIVNQGAIRAASGGSVALVAPRVQNAGTIEAPQGAVSLVAANAATVEYMADGLVQIRVDEGALQAEVANSGVLRADGGRVTLNAKALDSLARSVVNNSGIIEARSVENANGVVRLAGDDVTLQSGSIVSAAGGGQVEIYGSQVLADGLIDASSTSRGGSIKLLGDNVGLVGTARVDASGDLGGGEILVGGNLHGQGPEHNATAVYVGRDVLLDASARTIGDGGKVVVWSDQATRFYGSIKATGGAQGGDGGAVETSGRAWLDFQGRVDTRAPFGATGSLLLDPMDITISANATNGGTCAAAACFVLVPVGSVANLNVTQLTNVLANSNVSVNTTSGIATGNGDIFVNTPVTYTSTHSLSLTADRNINIASALTNASTGAINLKATNNVNVSANLSSGGAVNLSAANATFSAGAVNLNGTYSVSGTTTINGATVSFNSGATTTTTIANLTLGSGTLDLQSGTLLVQQVAGETNSGTINVAAGTVLSTNGRPLKNAGTIIGSGTLDLGSATFSNAGVVKPGGAGTVGTLTVLGAYDQGSNGVLAVDLASGANDVLSVSGAARLNGTLNVNYLGGYTGAGGRHGVLTYASLNGTFTAINDVNALSPTYGATAFTLVGPPASLPPVSLPPTPTPPPSTTGTATTTTISNVTGFDPATTATTAGGAALLTSLPAASAPLEVSDMAAAPNIAMAPAAQAGRMVPDIAIGQLIASMTELRTQKLKALSDAVRILERNPDAADLKPCHRREVADDCIADPPLDAQRGEPAAPTIANLPAIERKVALLIGEADYRGGIPKLGSPLKDIEDIGTLYREQFGYEVQILRNADKAAIVRALNRLILQSGPNDSVTVFYAGHGYVVEKTGRGYWIPARAAVEDPKQWLSNQDIAKVLQNIQARQVLLVSDSCYSGTLTRDAKLEKNEVLHDPAAVLARRSVTVLTSGGEEPVADAGKDGHSVFAWHFLRSLGHVEHWSTGVDVYEQVAEEVQRDFPQAPQYGAAIGAGHERGADFLFEVRSYER